MSEAPASAHMQHRPGLNTLPCVVAESSTAMLQTIEKGKTQAAQSVLTNVMVLQNDV